MGAGFTNLAFAECNVCYCFFIIKLNFLGGAIERICEEVEEEVLTDRGTLIRAARCLLGAITRVLLLADIVVVKQLLLAKDKVFRIVM